MSTQLGKLVSFILHDHFGEVVQSVGKYLYQSGPSSLLHIKKACNLSLMKVKLSLSILIKHGLVVFRPSIKETIPVYALLPDQVLLFLRYPKYLNLQTRKFGRIAEILVGLLLLNGRCSASRLILLAHRKLQELQIEGTLASIEEQFRILVTAQYVCRAARGNEEKPVPDLVVSDLDKFQLPSFDVSSLSKILLDEDRLVGECFGLDVDANQEWIVNFDRFHQDMRDKLIATSAGRKFDENAEELLKILIQQMYVRTQPWADVSNPIPKAEVVNMLRKLNAPAALMNYVEQYLTVLGSEPSRFIQKVGDSGGGQYVINMKRIVELLTWATCENIITEKFGSKAARIFRLVKEKGFIDSDQIQQLAMIPAKEAKNISYRLLEENFFQLQELKKAVVNTGPNKCFTLFCVDLNQVVRMVIEICHKATYNVMVKKLHTQEINMRIIEKKQRQDSIASGLKLQGATLEHLIDVEEMITPPEQEVLAKVETIMRKLTFAEIEVDDTLFILQLFTAYDLQ